MAGRDFDIHPSGVFGADYSVLTGSTPFTPPADGIFLPLSTLVGQSGAPTDHELTKAEAGVDHRKVAWGILEAYYAHMSELDVDSAIDNFTVTRGALSFTGEASSRRTYTISFQYGVGSMDIGDETAAP
jgi:hypothetical protein